MGEREVAFFGVWAAAAVVFVAAFVYNMISSPPETVAIALIKNITAANPHPSHAHHQEMFMIASLTLGSLAILLAAFHALRVVPAKRVHEIHVSLLREHIRRAARARLGGVGAAGQ